MGLLQRRMHGLPNAKHIMDEIERARLKADGIVTGRIEVAEPKVEAVVQPTPTRTGWKIGVKSRVAEIIRRAVWMNFRIQKVFNNSVIGVLQLMAEDLYARERMLNPGAQSGADGRATAGTFDRAAYEEEQLDSTSFCRYSVSLFRERLRADDVALDLFCGRGELLAAFAANSIEAVGVDPDASMVSLCRGRGLRALHSDIFEHLRNSPDASYGGIFAWRVAERLTNDETAELLKLAGGKLRRGGLFVASATNIDHLPALRKFYLDPSLVRPVPARLLEFMVKRSNLRIDHFRFSATANHGVEELSEPTLSRDLYPYDEYTIVAVND